jgi:hypothetical protein
MRVTMLLADAAQAVGGKLYILGGGWSLIGPDPVPTAIAIKIDMPWDEANRPHTLQIDLLDEDGQPALLPLQTEDDPEPRNRPMQIGGRFQTAQPPNLRSGTPLDVAFALNIPPLPLQPDRRYTWRCSIDGRSEEGWQVSFLTRPAQAPASS